MNRERTAVLLDLLVEACEKLETSLRPYRASDTSPERTYACSREAIGLVRDAFDKVKQANREAD